MTEEQFRFLSLVATTIAEHPEWMTDTLQAIQDGVLDRLEHERLRANKLDFAMNVLLMGATGRRLSEQFKPLVDDALAVSNYLQRGE